MQMQFMGERPPGWEAQLRAQAAKKAARRRLRWLALGCAVAAVTLILGQTIIGG